MAVSSSRVRIILIFTLLAFISVSLAFPFVSSRSRSEDSKPRDESKDESEIRKQPKYFHEPGGSFARMHYDGRYFQDEVPYAEHRLVLRDLVRSYYEILGKHGAESWLAHGTLLGWWWNGQVMPWDYDLDVQMSNDTLQWVADNLNRTEYTYAGTSLSEDGLEVASNKSFLMDINPHHSDLTKGDGTNIIDARWIDMQTGLFIDITGVRERDVKDPGVWSCKNNHQYLPQDIWPMRTTDFEGIKVLVPYNYQKVLSDEYGAKSLVAEQWQHHRWNQNNQEWVKMTEDEEKRLTLEAQKLKKLDMMNQRRSLFSRAPASI